MATSVQFRLQNRNLGMVMREVDEDLAIFLGMKNAEKERIVLANINNFEEFDASTSAEPKLDSLLVPNGLKEEAFQNLADDSLLNLEAGKSDHDWLLAQQDADEQDLAAEQADASSGECISLNSELPKSNCSDSSAAANKRPLSSGGRKPSSRAATPTRRPALAAKSKPSRASTPTSRVPSKPAAATSSKPMAAQVRASTPSRVAPRSSTPTSRTTTPAASSRPVSASRASTSAARSAPASATRKPATPSTKSPSDGTSARGKISSVATKNPVQTRGGGGGSSSRPSNPSEMLSRSHNAPQSVKTSMPKRPASASRGRPSAPLSSPSKVKPRQKSCSPTKARAPIGNARKNGSMTLSRSRGYSSHGGGGDDVNPVLMGTKMVERVVNMRKLAPPKQDEHISAENPKKSSHENSGFGRSLSKKSLDMAMRHMDIRRSVNVAGNLKPVATSVLSYFSNGNQSSSSQSSSFGVSESPITSSSDSSKSSNCVSSYFFDGRN